MTKVLAFATVCSLLFANVKAAYNPFADGATANVCVRVVDDEGISVKDAEVSLVFMTDAQKQPEEEGQRPFVRSA